MAFQPFGFPFAVDSYLSPEQVRTAIRGKLKGWFDPKSGARGWVVGSYVCLWNGAFDRDGPMLFGKIGPSNFGSRISGRAGSDLGGATALVPVSLLLALVMAVQVPRNGLDGGHVVGISVYVLVCALVLWSKHVFRKEATSLIAFLERTVGPQKDRIEARPSLTHLDRQSYPGIEFQIDGENQDAPSPLAVGQAIVDLGSDSFVTIARADQDFIQALRQDELFILEWCDGSSERHFQAKGLVGAEIVIGAMSDYLKGQQPFANIAHELQGR